MLVQQITHYSITNLSITRSLNYTMYIELHSRSAFSFLEGSSLPEELAGVCAELGMPAMALLDRDGVYGAPRFHLAAKKLGVRAHIGAEITFAPQRHRDTEQIDNLKVDGCGLKNHQLTSSPPINADAHGSNRQSSPFTRKCSVFPCV